MKKLILLLLVFTSSMNFGNAQWQKTTLPYYHAFELASIGNRIFAGSPNAYPYFIGVKVSTDNGVTWTDVSNGLGTRPFVYMLTAVGTDIFAVTDSAALFRSSNYGINWTSVYYEFPYAGSIGGMRNNLFAGTLNGILLSTDNGDSWTPASNGIPAQSQIMAFTTLGTNVFAGAGGDGFSGALGVFLSTDSAANWTYVSNGLPNNVLARALPVVGTNVIFGTDQGIFLSTDSGANWTSVLSNVGITSFAVTGQYIFAGVDYFGVFLSSDGGVSWTVVNNGFPTHPWIGSITISGTNIFASSDSDAVYRRPLSDMLSCQSNFSIVADTTQLHQYIATNLAIGIPPLSYVWSWGDGTYDTIPYPSHKYADSGFYTICLSITDSTGCANYFCDSSFHAMRTTNTMVYVNVVNPLLTGTKEVNIQTPQVTIYPNPAGKELRIVHSGMGINKIEIFNVLGKRVYNEQRETINYKPETVLDVSSLTAGIYFVQVSNESRRWTGKFVKE